MSDNYGPPQPDGGWQPDQRATPDGWQPQAPQGWHPQGRPGPSGPQSQPAQGWRPQTPQGPQAQPSQGWQSQPPAGWQPQGPAGWQSQGDPKPKKKVGAIVTAAVVVLALAVGVTVWLVSTKDTNTADGGQASPQAAASDMLLSLSSKDAVGVAQQLDPSEAQVFKDMSGDILGELKRLQIVKTDASAQALTGTEITMKNLTFDSAKEEKVNDHVTIVKLTGGTVTVNSNAAKLPFTSKMQKLIGSQLTTMTPQSKTYNIADMVKQNNGQPIRIATVKRGDKWYPSLFYSIADNWLQDAKKTDPALGDQSASAPITAVGAASPAAAVTTMIDKASSGDYQGVIGMLPPDEMGVLYDYGRQMLMAAKVKNGTTPADLPKISNLQFNTTAVTGGTKVSLKSVTVQVQGKSLGITVDAAGGRLTVEVDGQKQEISGDNLLTMIPGASSQLPPQMADLVKREFKSLLSVGVVTTQVNGKWYVSPLRSFSGMMLTVLKGMQPADIDYLTSLAGR